MFKVNNRRRSGVFTVNFENITHIVLVFLLLSFSMWLPAGNAYQWKSINKTTQKNVGSEVLCFELLAYQQKASHHQKGKSLDVSNTIVPMVTKLGRIVTNLEWLPPIKLFEPLMTWSCKIMWQTKTIISPPLNYIYTTNCITSSCFTEIFKFTIYGYRIDKNLIPCFYW